MISKLLKSIVLGIALNIYASSDNIYVFLTTANEMDSLTTALKQPETCPLFSNTNESNQRDDLKQAVQAVFKEKPQHMAKKEETGTIHAFLANKKINANANNFIRMSKEEFLIFDGSSQTIQNIIKQEMLMFHGYGYESDAINWDFTRIKISKNINSKDNVQLTISPNEIFVNLNVFNVQLTIFPNEIFVSLNVFNILLENRSKLTCRFPKLTNVLTVEEAKNAIPRIQFFDKVLFWSAVSTVPLIAIAVSVTAILLAIS